MKRRAVQLFIDPPDFGIVVHGVREWPVNIAFTPLHYGGHRRWLVCPYCQSRRQALYIKGERLACRQCLGLRYESNHENQRQRGFRATDKLRVELGWKPGILNPIGPKPKGMRWNTFWRIVSEINQRTDALLGNLKDWAERAESSSSERRRARAHR